MRDLPTTPPKVAFLVASLNRQLQKEMEQQLYPRRIPVEQIRVLEVLSLPNQEKGIEMTTLARTAVIDPSTLTKMVERMISEGLVYRAADPADRRRVKVLITAEGAAIFEQLRPARDRQEAELQSLLEKSFSEGESGDLSAILERLCGRVIESNS